MELAAEASKYKEEGYQAMKLRFGWGPTDGAEACRHNVALVRTVRETVGDGIDIMADAYMGWKLDYAKRMLPLLEPFQLRWLEEAGHPRRHPRLRGTEAHGPHPDLRRRARVHALGLPRTDRSPRGGLHPVRHQSRRRPDARRARSPRSPRRIPIPVIPHAGQMHNYHIVMASLNSPMAEYFPPVDVEVGNELFWYIFKGEPMAKDGFVDLDENLPGLGLTVDEAALKKFNVIE